MDLKSAKAVISGGASGLGLASATAVVNAGGHAVLLDVNEEQGAKSAQELGDRATFVRTDVTSEDGVRDSCNSAADFMGGITLAVNCAGILLPAGGSASGPSCIINTTNRMRLRSRTCW